jgi:hypothetical protein
MARYERAHCSRHLLFSYGCDDFAAVAVDSRENIGEDHRDDICKIKFLDNCTIFVPQGIARGSTFSAIEIAEKKLKHESNQPARTFVLHYGFEAKTGWTKISSESGPGSVVSDPPIYNVWARLGD